MLLHVVHALPAPPLIDLTRVGSPPWSAAGLLPVQAPAPPGGGIPNPAPAAPPGSERLTQILSYMKWLALSACAVAFLGGIIAFTAGRVVDNRRYGNTGALMMIAAVGGAILFGVGPAILNGFAAG